MHSDFPTDEISDSFWGSTSASLPMNRSASEWAFEQFLDEVVSPPPPPPASSAHSSTSKREDVDEEILEIKKPDRLPPSDPPSTTPIDSDQYRELLKSKLDRACAAVALSRPADSNNAAQTPSVVSKKPQQLTSGIHNKGGGYGLHQSEVDAGPLGVPALPALQKKAQTTSGSSKDDSEDDDLEGDIEITENMDPADVKRVRRMLSNRESARRSRRRKQAQMTDLETQAGQVRVENSGLLKQLTDVNHKYDNSVVDRRILEANIETLRAKVKMAEESVKRKTGINPLLLAMSNVVPRASMSSLGNPMNASANSSVPIQPTSNHLFHPVAPNINTPPHHQRLDSMFPGNPSIPLGGNQQTTVERPPMRGSNTTEVPPVQRTDGVDRMHQHYHHQQQQLRPGMNLREALPAWNPQIPHQAPKNK